MEPRLLLCDIGNTAIKLGLGGPQRVLACYSLPTRAETADSFGVALLGILRHAGVTPGELSACVFSSVAPAVDPVFREAVSKYIGCPCLQAPADLPVPLENRYQRPEEVGADRLVGAYAARRLYPETRSLVIVDFGTAATFDCVSGQAYEGGLIFPGPMTALAALASSTAKLPLVNLDIHAPEPAPGRDTATSIRHGLVFGFVCLTEGLSGILKRQMPGPCKVLATGGFAQEIARLSGAFDAVVPALLLEGLRMLYHEKKGA